MTGLESRIEGYFINLLSSPLVLDDRLIHYVESTWGLGDKENLAEALRDEGFKEDFLDVVFYPSPEEIFFAHSILGNSFISLETIFNIGWKLAKQISELFFVFKGGEFSVSIGGDRLISFIRKTKLYLPPIPPLVYKEISCLSSAVKGEVLYLLKGALLEWDDTLQGFFKMFFKRFSKEEEGPCGYLRLIFNIWDGKGGASGLCSLLVKRCAQLEDRISQLDETSEKIASHGLEYVLTSRIPMCAISRQEREMELARTRHLLWSLFPHALTSEYMF